MSPDPDLSGMWGSLRNQRGGGSNLPIGKQVLHGSPEYKDLRGIRKPFLIFESLQGVSDMAFIEKIDSWGIL